MRVSTVLYLALVICTSFCLGSSHASETNDEKKLQKAKELTERFFYAIASNESKKVTDQFTEGLKTEVDVPILEAWMKAINEHYGEVVAINIDLKESNRWEFAQRSVLESKATVEFDNGVVVCTLVAFNNEIDAMSFDAEYLNSDEWFQGPPSSELYEEKAKELLTAFADQEMEKFYSMMHPNTQKLINKTDLRTLYESMESSIGPVEEIEIASSTMRSVERKRQLLFVKTKIIGSFGEVEAYVGFEFANFKGHIVSYQIFEPSLVD